MTDHAAPPRLSSVDLLRGIVMALMALDHTRDFFTAGLPDPLDLVRSNTGLFLTRWVTHFCAPTFMLLAGLGAYLSLGRGRSRAALSRFLFIRGLWLVFLEVTVIHIGWYFNLDLHFTLAQVIWALGWSMVALSVLIWLPLPIIAGIAVTTIVGHNLFDSVSPASLGAFGAWWTVLHVPGTIAVMRDIQIYILYPLVPWIGVMAVGYALGPVLQWQRARRRRTLAALGIVLTLLFIGLRASNVYGDPSLWSPQRDMLWTIFSFVNTTKYPPSLLFLLMTLGPALCLLAFFDQVKGRWEQPFLVFGRVPLFYYIVHLLLIHAAAVAYAVLIGFAPSFLFANPGRGYPHGYGLDLPQLYLVWLGIVLLLLPICWWFMRLKQQRHVWLRFL